jgi:hypothetical protein
MTAMNLWHIERKGFGTYGEFYGFVVCAETEEDALFKAARIGNWSDDPSEPLIEKVRGLLYKGLPTTVEEYFEYSSQGFDETDHVISRAHWKATVLGGAEPTVPFGIVLSSSYSD